MQRLKEDRLGYSEKELDPFFIWEETSSKLGNHPSRIHILVAVYVTKTKHEGKTKKTRGTQQQAGKQTPEVLILVDPHVRHQRNLIHDHILPSSRLRQSSSRRVKRPRIIRAT
ncbi:unnamed protein product [Darwinula stevensoni]|uniref:Uncharacterized protein n=1 Tax=Darwinula stevensoni TaxID=69355 RepID=A0A7R8XHT4_9CRUS|nr:unnamed protein product [Darwinula stevensoni]CAG0893775.1 unnamed protein product [Darwinula stevensoni]